MGGAVVREPRARAELGGLLFCAARGEPAARYVQRPRINVRVPVARV